MPFGVSRVAECDVQHPTTIHAVKAKSLDKEHVQKYLDDFLDDYDRILTTSAVSSEGSMGLNTYVGPKTTTISQLKRLQRELRGLPPVILEEEEANPVVSSISVPKNKKIVFDDDGETKGEKEEEKKDNDDEIQPKYTESSESESESNDSDSVSEPENEQDGNESENNSIKESKKRKAEEIEESEEEERKHKKHEHKHKHKHND